MQLTDVNVLFKLTTSKAQEETTNRFSSFKNLPQNLSKTKEIPNDNQTSIALDPSQAMNSMILKLLQDNFQRFDDTLKDMRNNMQQMQTEVNDIKTKINFDSQQKEWLEK